MNVRDEVTVFLTKKLGFLGSLALAAMQLLTGHSDTLAETTARKGEQALPQNTGGSKSDRLPSEDDKRQQARELAENCVVSEILSSFILFALVGTDIVFDAAGVGGMPSVTIGMSQSQRAEALKVYAIILVFQVAGLCVSHRILRHKDALAEKLQWLSHWSAAVKQHGRMALPKAGGAGTSIKKGTYDTKWHFFLR